jgi:hypothetical protein
MSRKTHTLLLCCVYVPWKRVFSAVGGAALLKKNFRVFQKTWGMESFVGKKWESSSFNNEPTKKLPVKMDLQLAGKDSSWLTSLPGGVTDLPVRRRVRAVG